MLALRVPLLAEAKMQPSKSHRQMEWLLQLTPHLAWTAGSCLYSILAHRLNHSHLVPSMEKKWMEKHEKGMEKH